MPANTIDEIKFLGDMNITVIIPAMFLKKSFRPPINIASKFFLNIIQIAINNAVPKYLAKMTLCLSASTSMPFVLPDLYAPTTEVIGTNNNTASVNII